MKAVTEAKGNPFYRDHLPLVGEDIEVGVVSKFRHLRIADMT